MKHMKKLTSILLALVMALGLATTALAVNVTIAGTEKDGILEGHTFVAYQVFQGDEADGVLSNVVWGDNISSNSGEFLAALKTSDTFMVEDTSEGAAEDAKVNAFANCETAADVAEAMGQFENGSNEAKAIAKLAYDKKTGTGIPLKNGEENTLPDGYYLIVDETENVGNGGAYNAMLLRVVGDKVDITIKTGVPTVEKKVKENVKYTENGGYGSGYNDVADYNIGDHVPFKLIGSVPDMANYETYVYEFHDTMDNGLTLDNDSIRIYFAESKDADASALPDKAGLFTITKGDHALDISIADLKKVEGIGTAKYIIVEYTATLNSAAVIGLEGNTNKVSLTYSNNPNETTSTGKTVEDKVIVFTYELDTTKVDGKDSTKKLEGAEFHLYREVNGAKEWAVVDSDSRLIGWAPTGYSDVDRKTEILVDGKLAEYGGSTLTSAKNTGLFQVIGLDDGTYFLQETKAPAGYNLLSGAVKVIISAKTINNQEWGGVADTALTELKVNNGDASGVVSTGAVQLVVENNSGTELPETGGIGTTIFYIVGGVLAVGAVVLLVTKKRMDAKD